MKHCLASALVMMMISGALAAPDVAEVRSPDGGVWQGQMPGAFIVFKSNAWDTGPSALYRRELLLGVDARGFPVLQYANSESPDGPWDKPTLQTRPFDPKPAKTTPLADKTFTVENKPIACHGMREESTVDGNSVVTETWTDAATGRKISTTKTTKAAGAVFGSGEVIEETLETIEPRHIGDHDVAVAIYRSTTFREGRPYMSRRIGTADEVPGKRVLYQRWVGGGEPPARLSMDELVVSTGTDADTVTFVTGKAPTTAPAAP